jgi:hypothetical protein
LIATKDRDERWVNIEKERKAGREIDFSGNMSQS